MIGRMWVMFMRLMAVLPLSWVRALGWLLGRALFVVLGSRRRIAETNLRLCFPDQSPAALDDAVDALNADMERLIRQCPQQYLWGYARYKAPRGEAATATAAAAATDTTTATTGKGAA